MHETKETYGKNIIMAAVSGAKTARLKEIGAFDYKSYGTVSSLSLVQIRKQTKVIIGMY